MRETCTSGSVRGGGDNVPTYSAVDGPGRRQVTAECGGLMQVTVCGEELQLAGGECFPQVAQEQPAEHPRQHLNRQEESRPTGDPAFTVRRDPTAGDQKMNVRMVTPTPTIP